MNMSSAANARQFFLPTATEVSIRELDDPAAIPFTELFLPDLSTGDMVIIVTLTNTLILEMVRPQMSRVNVWRVDPEKNEVRPRFSRKGFAGEMYALPRLVINSPLCLATPGHPMEVGLTPLVDSMRVIRY